MKYMLLMYANEEEMEKYNSENTQAVPQAWSTLNQEAEAAGILLSTSGLAPVANATTLRVRDGKFLITDGPFAETHEQMGGYFLLDCQDLDEAMKWAARIPTAQYGSIEIRPLWGQQ